VALQGNYSVILKSAGSFRAGPSVSDNRANFNRGGANRNPWSGWANWSNKSAIPSGYNAGTAWVIPQKAGGLATFNSITGTGSLSNGNLAGGLNAVAPLTGSGDITNANLVLVLSAVASLTGSGALVGDILGKLEAAAALSGAGALAGDLKALASLIAALSGTGDASATIKAIASASADIVVTGDVLSTANVAEAVWGALAESGYTYQDFMKILAAVAAGKTTIVDNGGGAATVTFRNIGDTLDRVEADMQDSERQTITLDLG
jgi:hypothetical protein